MLFRWFFEGKINFVPRLLIKKNTAWYPLFAHMRQSQYTCSYSAPKEKCTASKRTLLLWLIMNADHPVITFVNFCCEKYLLAVYKCVLVIPTHLHCLQETFKVGSFHVKSTQKIPYSHRLERKLVFTWCLLRY